MVERVEKQSCKEFVCKERIQNCSGAFVHILMCPGVTASTSPIAQGRRVGFANMTGSRGSGGSVPCNSCTFSLRFLQYVTVR